jgi:hypothetical protein
MFLDKQAKILMTLLNFGGQTANLFSLKVDLDVQYSSATFENPALRQRGFTKERAMRKVFILLLIPMFFAAMACNKSSDETSAPAASPAAPAESSPAAAAPEASPAESPAASPAGS